jgi:hypothetical protein
VYQTIWSQGRDVVVEGHTIGMGNRWGAGREIGEGKGRGEVSLQATWDQSGQGSHHMQRRDSKLVRGTRKQGRVRQAKGELSRGFVKGFVPCALIYCQPCIYRAIVCMLANKGIVFRL